MLNNMPGTIFTKYVKKTDSNFYFFFNLFFIKKPMILEHELEPMIWAYVLDVRVWFTSDFYVQYGRNFKNIWAASAYKG